MSGYAPGAMTWTHRPALDGLRSVAVYLVLLFHAGLSAVDGGFVGVDLFFVLSGFVLAHAYAARVRDGLPARAFLRGRLDEEGIRSTISSRTGNTLPSIVTVSRANSGLPRGAAAWANTSRLAATIPLMPR